MKTGGKKAGSSKVGDGEWETATIGKGDQNMFALGLGKFQVLKLLLRTSRTAAVASARFCW